MAEWVYCSFCGRKISKTKKKREEHEDHYCGQECRDREKGPTEMIKGEKHQRILDYLDENPGRTINELKEELDFPINRNTLKHYIKVLYRDGKLERESDNGTYRYERSW